MHDSIRPAPGYRVFAVKGARGPGHGNTGDRSGHIASHAAGSRVKQRFTAGWGFAAAIMVAGLLAGPESIPTGKRNVEHPKAGTSEPLPSFRHTQGIASTAPAHAASGNVFTLMASHRW